MSDNLICESCLECERDRQKWGPGPWQDEPNRVEFEHAGLPCILHRGFHGAWCGYAGVAPGHPMHGEDYDLPEVEVHGGLTYAAKCDGRHICHVAKPGEPDDVWWFGFDCCHGFDSAPGMSMRFPGATYKDMRYVRSQTERLAEQLAAMK